ncbi:hypothetical protein [Streptomyces atratus]|uniref:Uncharacterized protein n=1 Tax=Streptomyces atratus TaxID=1893 RepID=A0A2Z5J942_STRAR|nr:hypothetical protein C5746_07980 [Streptomyces atratus]
MTAVTPRSTHKDGPAALPGMRGIGLRCGALELKQFFRRRWAGSREYGKVALVLGARCVGGPVLRLLTFRRQDRRDG